MLKTKTISSENYEEVLSWRKMGIKISTVSCKLFIFFELEIRKPSRCTNFFSKRVKKFCDKKFKWKKKNDNVSLL